MAIGLAVMLKIEYPISAGIIAILTIQPTKRETIQTALGRLNAFVVALLISFVCFYIVGINYWAYLIYIIIYIFICHRFSWNNAITMNAVLISHFVTFRAMNTHTVVNEILLFAIGVGIGVIANLHLHKKVDYIEGMKVITDRQIANVLNLISDRILNNRVEDYNEDSFVKLEKLLREAKNIAEENYNNQFDKTDIFDIEYIAMREKQYIILYDMYKMAVKLQGKPFTAEKVSGFLKKLSDAFAKDDDGRELMEQFVDMDRYMKAQVLPTDRTEFEDRARLFNLMRKIEEFIRMKILFYEEYKKAD